MQIPESELDNESKPSFLSMKAELKKVHVRVFDGARQRPDRPDAGQGEVHVKVFDGACQCPDQPDAGQFLELFGPDDPEYNYHSHGIIALTQKSQTDGRRDATVAAPACASFGADGREAPQQNSQAVW